MRHDASLLFVLMPQNVGIPKSFSSIMYGIPKFSENELFSVFFVSKNSQSFGMLKTGFSFYIRDCCHLIQSFNNSMIR